jgi:hypothetical protein
MRLRLIKKHCARKRQYSLGNHTNGCFLHPSANKYSEWKLQQQNHNENFPPYRTTPSCGAVCIFKINGCLVGHAVIISRDA